MHPAASPREAPPWGAADARLRAAQWSPLAQHCCGSLSYLGAVRPASLALLLAARRRPSPCDPGCAHWRFLATCHHGAARPHEMRCNDATRIWRARRRGSAEVAVIAQPLRVAGLVSQPAPFPLYPLSPPPHTRTKTHSNNTISAAAAAGRGAVTEATPCIRATHWPYVAQHRSASLPRRCCSCYACRQRNASCNPPLLLLQLLLPPHACTRTGPKACFLAVPVSAATGLSGGRFEDCQSCRTVFAGCQRRCTAYDALPLGGNLHFCNELLPWQLVRGRAFARAVRPLGLGLAPSPYN